MLFLLFLFILYLVFLIAFVYATLRLTLKTHSYDQSPGISIIIAIRNGQESLPRLIDDLTSQNYIGPLEFILVDDESTDQTKAIIDSTVKIDNRFKYFSSNQGSSNLLTKKKALDVGINNASHDYLLFSDVDCRIPSSWAKIMSGYFIAGYEYLVGFSFINYKKPNNYISIFQRIDFLLLMVMCRASNYFGYPLASSGQNQGFTKSLYSRSGGFLKINSFIGDDTAFLQHCNNIGCKSIFIDNQQSFIISRKEFKLLTFLSQRIRWVSDANKLWKLNLNFFFILFISFLSFCAFPIIIYNNISNYIFVGTIVVLKIIIEFLLLYCGANKFNIKFKLYEFLWWELLHIPYIAIIGILSYFVNFFSWRGRRLI